MIYTPTKNPKGAVVMIMIISLLGIIGGYLFSEYFLLVALLFWMQYTAVLSYLQFKKKKKHKYNSFTELLLHPQIRFFTFELIAFWGASMLVIKEVKIIGVAALIAWMMFSLNFYFYYRKRRNEYG